MPATPQTKKLVLDFFRQKVGSNYLTGAVSTPTFDLLTNTGLARDDIHDSIQELIDEKILFDRGRAIGAGVNYPG